MHMTSPHFLLVTFVSLRKSWPRAPGKFETKPCCPRPRLNPTWSRNEAHFPGKKSGR